MYLSVLCNWRARQYLHTEKGVRKGHLQILYILHITFRQILQWLQTIVLADRSDHFQCSLSAKEIFPHLQISILAANIILIFFFLSSYIFFNPIKLWIYCILYLGSQFRDLVFLTLMDVGWLRNSIFKISRNTKIWTKLFWNSRK